MRALSAVILLVAMSLGSAGCAARLARLEPAAEARISEAIVRRAQAIQSGRMLLTADLETPEGRRQLRQVVVFELPRRLRIEQLVPGQSFAAGVLVAGEEGALLLDVPNRIAYTAVDADELLEAMLGFPLSPEDFISLITGNPPPPVQGGAELGSRGGRVIVRSPSGAEFSLLAPDYLPVSAEMPLGGIGLGELVVTFVSYGEFDGMEIPDHSRIEAPGIGLSGEAHLRHVTLNRGISDALFDQRIPPGFAVRDLSSSYARAR